jgi:HSP20 family molecular chaperone IbpA
MSRLQVFSSPLLLGVDGLEQMLDRTTKSASDGYPPYNIERFAPQVDGAEKYRIVLAVAGFTRDELEVVVEQRQLIVKGKQVDDKSREFLHRGIAARQFSRSFLLADGMQTTSARLANGLLSIDLLKAAPDRAVQRIEIE